jgi:protein-disulfide isomerase
MSNTPKQSKNERRDAAREKAREQRLRQQRREKRNRAVLQLSIGVVIVAIVAVVAVVIVNSVKPPGPGPRNMASGGITIGAGLKATTTGAIAGGGTPAPAASPSGKVVIQAWEDFGCPACGSFETTNAANIEALVKSGSAVVEYFPVAILDRNFTDGNYSSRAANAGAAVANWSPDTYFAFHKLMYANRPEEGGPGLTNDKLIALAKQAKSANLAKITKAIRDQQFASWVKARTDEFVNGKGNLSKVTIPAANKAATPTVVVNGKYFDGDITDANAFGSFVTSVGGAYTAAPTPTPTPTPSPTKTKKK